MCSTCPTTTSKHVQMCLGNCRTTTWCLPPSFRSIAPVPGRPAALPSSPNSSTADMVSFQDPGPRVFHRKTVGAVWWTRCGGRARTGQLLSQGYFTNLAHWSVLPALGEAYCRRSFATPGFNSCFFFFFINPFRRCVARHDPLQRAQL